jgi:hypothetical protein
LVPAVDGPPDPADVHAASAAVATMPSALSRIASRGARRPCASAAWRC